LHVVVLFLVKIRIYLKFMFGLLHKSGANFYSVTMNPVIQSITKQLIERSQASRATYLNKITQMRLANRTAVARRNLGAANQAHGYAALGKAEQIVIREQPIPLIAIVSAYNDVLSAHQPLETYPAQLKEALKKAGAMGHFAGGVPAMCDGVTQGRDGMELSLFSRDVIAMSTGVAMSHEMYDGMLLLGVCDKIVPGLLLGALAFGHLPAIFVPAGPMPSGLSNEAKANIRKQFAKGEVGDSALLDAEMAAYHSAGTCTFYGTANSNQLLLEAMGLMVPGAAFVQPNDALRTKLTQAAGTQVAALALAKQSDGHPIGIGEMVSAECIINAVVALLATGGSTNHTIHWVAIARAAGWQLEWSDFDALSAAVPLLARVYPNGAADVNDMHAAGGTAYIFKELLDAGLMWDSVQTVAGRGLRHFTQVPQLQNEAMIYQACTQTTLDQGVLRPAVAPFQADGGMKLLKGNIGTAVVKVSAVAPQSRNITAPCAVFTTQEAVQAAFKAGELNRDVVVVLRGQGPKACGMPELHKLTPPLTILQDKGYNVALVTDGRMSGASGKVLAAIHLTPEAVDGGLIAKLCDGDLVTVNALTGDLSVALSDNELAAREALLPQKDHAGMGREMFAAFRKTVNRADQGATVLEF
jgi:phosphogluconate dehydratase